MADPKKEAARLLEKYFADLDAASRAAQTAARAGGDRVPAHRRNLPAGEPSLLFRGLLKDDLADKRSGVDFYSPDPEIAHAYATDYDFPSPKARPRSWRAEGAWRVPGGWAPQGAKPRIVAALHEPTKILDLTGEAGVPPWAMDTLSNIGRPQVDTMRLIQEFHENERKHGRAHALRIARDKVRATPEWDTPGHPYYTREVRKALREGDLPHLDLEILDRDPTLFAEAKKRGYSTVKFSDYSDVYPSTPHDYSYVPLGDVEPVGVYSARTTSPLWGEKLPESAKQLELPFDPNVGPNISDKLKRFLKKLPAIGTAVGAALIPGEVQAAYDRGGETEAAKVLAVELARMGDPGFELLYELAAAVPDAASYIARLGASKRELQRPAGEKMY